ncbi:hypothetical protein AJ80_01903 [Polytolypa hystricis UAMH7299]|uniref:Chitin-binding type-4 domain-containing protein n=1 Tax=Polytolypa hystricis (strain UAMH7299) TaxID=1447883 RepID=A0A2B7YYL2_POLH7|nr:hypothetical protein AJ80_01903 [Polytolypa hystricis UAMH7299]
MHLLPTAFVGLIFAVQTYAHGLLAKPATRAPDAATAAVCGQTMVDFYKQDNTSYPEALIRADGLDEDYDAENCNLWLCKGFQFEDNTENVFEYKPGDVVDLEVFIRIAHLGYANVSVVDTATNTVVGDFLKLWEDGYADPEDSPDFPEDQTNFSVTIPELDGKCTQAGECVIQWYWFGQGQTYESCIDFTVPAPELEPEPEETECAGRTRSWRS